jgi:hypothetical protein
MNSIAQNCTTISSAAKNNIRQLNLLREKQWGVTKNDEFSVGFKNILKFSFLFCRTAQRMARIILDEKKEFSLALMASH